MITQKELINILNYIAPVKIIEYIDIANYILIEPNQKKILLEYKVPSGLIGVIKKYSAGATQTYLNKLFFWIEINKKIYPDPQNVSQGLILTGGISGLGGGSAYLNDIHIEIFSDDIIKYYCENKTTLNINVFARLVGWLWKK